MWVFLALGSAAFAALTSILAKCGIRKTDSTVATAIRTVVVLLMSFCMVLIVGSLGGIREIGAKTWVFLILSGLATGASWLCYFRALGLGDVNRVVPIDKSSTILSILLAFIILHEPISWLKGICVVLIAVGTYLMIEKKKSVSGASLTKTAETAETAETVGMTETADATDATETAGTADTADAAGAVCVTNTSTGATGVPAEVRYGTGTGKIAEPTASRGRGRYAWLLFACLSALFAAISGRELLFICLSGLATGASWLCYYRALQLGPASVVVPIDKLSILLTVAFSCLFLHEKLTRRAAVGLALIVGGTLLMLVKI